MQVMTRKELRSQSRLKLNHLSSRFLGNYIALRYELSCTTLLLSMNKIDRRYRNKNEEKSFGSLSK